MDTLRVTLISSLPPHKGVTPYTMHLLDALGGRDDVRVDAIGFRSLYPRFAYPGGDPAHHAPKRADAAGARAMLSWWNPASWLKAAGAARGDIVHAQWWSWFLGPTYVATLATAKRRGKKSVVTAHNVRAHEDAPWKHAMNSAVLRLADRIIVHSQQNRETLIAQGHAADRIEVVPHGALSLETPPGATRASARIATGIPADAPVVLLPGNLRPYKGAQKLLEAARALRETVPNLRVVIAGELWKGCPDPRETAKELGVADLVDARIGYLPDDELALLLVGCDAVALPYTHFDAQTGAGTLALSAGRALVVSRTGGLPDLVRDERAIVPPGDSQALASALAAVLTDAGLRARLERDSLATAAELSWERIAERTVDVYRRTLGQQANQPAMGAAA
jgi:glycosyltransferase involved in cell wall biosynthesis